MQTLRALILSDYPQYYEFHQSKNIYCEDLEFITFMNVSKHMELGFDAFLYGI